MSKDYCFEGAMNGSITMKKLYDDNNNYYEYYFHHTHHHYDYHIILFAMNVLFLSQCWNW